MFAKKEKLLLFPANGTLIPLSEVPDEVFSSGMLGIGAAVLPSEGSIYAPMSGRIESIADSRHAYTLVSEDGVELMIHIGIDTVSLRGKGFLSLVSKGERVRAGDRLARVDLEVLKQEKLPSHVIVLITDPDTVDHFTVRSGQGLGGKSELAVYRLPNRKKE